MSRGGIFELLKKDEKAEKPEVKFVTRFSEHDIPKDGGFPASVTIITATLPDLEKKK